MTREEFIAAVGREPEQDDLDRANCELAGAIGHWSCGVCPTHGAPEFVCLCAARAKNSPTDADSD